MLDLLRKDVLEKRYMLNIADFIDKDEAADGLLRKLFT